ncbi:MAG: sulfotransferase [Anaerolineae bacterium]|nr:sulfotransferase [Anaerolineae bacterium]
MDPIIVIGMHRSGTTMITDILEKMGLFMGVRQNVMQEAQFFFEINKWLLELSGGSWILPETYDSLQRDLRAYNQVTNYVRFLLNTPRTISYLGVQRYLQFRTPASMNTPWGWKDPRTTYMLPLWLKIFPEARVIHIHRNGIDVAQSLHVRSQLVTERYFDRWQLLRWRWLHILGWGIYPRYNAHYLTLDEGFKLWEMYTRRADEHIAGIPAVRTRTICYEEFLQNPLPLLEDLCEFVGLRTQPDALNEAVASIIPARRNAYQHDEKLRSFYEMVRYSPQMIKYGYDHDLA